MNRDGLDAVVNKFNEMGCKLNVIGVDFEDVDDDSSDDEKEKDFKLENSVDNDDDVDDKKSHALISEVNKKNIHIKKREHGIFLKTF